MCIAKGKTWIDSNKNSGSKRIGTKIVSKSVQSNSVSDYGLWILTLLNSLCERLEQVQNEQMRTILGWTRDIPIAKVRYLLGWSSIRSRFMLA